MHRFSRMHLSPEAALRSLAAIDLEEKSRVAEGVALIAVIDHRRDYLAAGHPSMCDYCVRRLHMSEDKALRRIQVARAALKYPELFECLADGRLSVSSASELAPHLEPATAADLLEASAYRADRRSGVWYPLLRAPRQQSRRSRCPLMFRTRQNHMRRRM